MNTEQLLELKSIVDEYTIAFNEKGTDNMCYIISISLASYLEFLGYQVRLTSGTFTIDKSFVNKMPDSEIKSMLLTQEYECNHYWITLGNGLIIDATADQLNRLYNLPKLEMNYIGKKPEWYPEED